MRFLSEFRSIDANDVNHFAVYAELKPMFRVSQNDQCDAWKALVVSAISGAVVVGFLAQCCVCGELAPIR